MDQHSNFNLTILEENIFCANELPQTLTLVECVRRLGKYNIKAIPW